MLIVISDTHFSDGTAGDHNLPENAFSNVFNNDIISLIKQEKPTEVTLLLLGDIFDLLRTRKWFEYPKRAEFPVDDRPWGKNGLRDVETFANAEADLMASPKTTTEQRCLDILGQMSSKGVNGHKEPTILGKNWESLGYIRNFPAIVNEECKELDFQVAVKVKYIPGNHDRMINLYPSLAAEVKKILGIQGMDGKWFEYDHYDPEYKVFARHGHEFDVNNYGNDKEDYTRKGQIQVSIGDPLTTEFVTRLPWEASKLTQQDTALQDRLVRQLEDLDNLRPLSLAVEYIYNKVRMNHEVPEREALDAAFDSMAKNFLNLEFLKHWNNKKSWYDEAAKVATFFGIKSMVGAALTSFSPEYFLKLFMSLGDSGDSAMEPAAFNDCHARKNDKYAEYIVYGHTHTPLQKPLDHINVGGEERGVQYINTGTWRERIEKTSNLDKTPDFMKMKQMTYLVFYTDNNTEQKRMELWSGIRRGTPENKVREL